jgi:hypothetical protein
MLGLTIYTWQKSLISSHLFIKKIGIPDNAVLRKLQKNSFYFPGKKTASFNN